MARIPETELERIKTEVSLLRLVEAKGIVMKRHGKDWLGHCPFHDDKTPSLVVSPEKNLWHCLGACNTGGSVIDWVMKAEGVSFRHAVELLQQDFVPTGGVVVKRSLAPKLPTLSAGEQADDAALLGRVVDYYHQRLLQSEAGLAYLAGRGLNHPELIATFRLGFVDRTLGYYLPYGRCQEGQALRGQLQRLGVLRASGHEHFRGCVVVPVEDRGVIGEVYGRRIGPVKGGESAHYYLPGAHAGIWNRQALETHEEIILCESLLDAMSFWVNGYRNVTCSWGVNGFTGNMASSAF
jgi:DNA primase catalytic core